MRASHLAALLAVATIVLIAAGAFGVAQYRERVQSTPDPYEPYRQTVQALARPSPTLEAYERGRRTVRALLAGIPTTTAPPVMRAPSPPGITLGDIHRCAEDYARVGYAGLNCSDRAVDACVRSFLSTSGVPPIFQCSNLALAQDRSTITTRQIEACVRDAFGEATPFSILNCRD